MSDPQDPAAPLPQAQRPETVEAIHTIYSAGTRVPSWILAMQPQQIDHDVGEIRFNVDCDVFDLPESYLFIPRVVGMYGGLLNITGRGCKIFAPKKYVRIATSSELIGDDVWRSTGPPATFQPKPDAPASPLPKDPPRKFFLGLAAEQLVIGVAMLVMALVLIANILHQLRA